MAIPPPASPMDGSVPKKSNAMVATVPLETQAAFWPFNIQSSPSFLPTSWWVIFGSWKWGW